VFSFKLLFRFRPRNNLHANFVPQQPSIHEKIVFARNN